MIDRYSRQTLVPEIGHEGQAKLGKSSLVIIGCGALGTVSATTLVRAGVGKVKIVDRDFIEYHNLQRQVLFDEEDIKSELPKAVAAERHLRKINSSIEVEGIVADVNYANIEKLVEGADLIVDGLDNLETRLLINDVSLKHKIPWVYGGAISSSGMTMNIIPGETPCFRCLWANPTTGSGMALTCDTAGVIGPAPFIVGSLQTVEVMKILIGSPDINRDLIVIDVWRGETNHLKVGKRADCPACRGEYEFLEAKFGAKTTSLCGQNAVQVLNMKTSPLSFEKLASQLTPLGEVKYNEFVLRFLVRDGDNEMVVFPDGRAIINNTEDESLAKGMYSKYIGM
ncbi:MAG: ThiF family adenylyltransferase [Dehalococcoidales bacterium]